MDILKKAMMGEDTQEIQPPLADPNAFQEAQSGAEIAQVNDEAKSPNLQTKPELAQTQMKQEVQKTVPGQMQDQKVASEVQSPADKLRQTIAAYETKMNAPQKDPGINLADALAGAHNIVNYGSGSKQKNMAMNNASKLKAASSQERSGKLNELDKLRGMYQQLQASQGKGKMTDFQKAQLSGQDKDRALKEKISKLKASTEKKKGRSKLEETREKNIANRYDQLQEQLPNRKANIDEAKAIMKLISADELDTGPGSGLAGDVGSFFDTEESTSKQRLDSLAERAARAQLKANGETRPTDADVEGMKRSMFNLGNTEDANLKKLQDFIEQQEAGISEYDQMKGQLESGEGLEDFLLKPTFESKQNAGENEVKRKTKDGKVAVFNAETKEFIRYE